MNQTMRGRDRRNGSSLLDVNSNVITLKVTQFGSRIGFAIDDALFHQSEVFPHGSGRFIMDLDGSRRSNEGLKVTAHRLVLDRPNQWLVIVLISE